ncbi:MAG: hypothetical protein LBV17_02615 [Treponema sp.]|jgi:hypothetical protein|nr:hypothetical protein [Treponema sp.]
MNGFIYDEKGKRIKISDDGKNPVIWENVEKKIAEEAGEMFKKGEKIDDFLLQHNCKRFWGANR